VHDAGAADIPRSTATGSSVAKRTAEVEAFYKEHARWVLKVLMGHGLGAQEAEDAMQEALLKAWLQCDKPIEKLPQWVVSVCVHDARARAKRKTKGAEVLTGDAELLNVTLEDDPGEVAWERREAVLKHAKTLPTDQRRVIELKIDGWNRNEIAEELGKTPKQISDLQARGVRALQAVADVGGQAAQVPRQCGWVSAGVPAADTSMGGEA
jgi:RNA polymerase sigma factor (sigma-70 family)